MLTRKSTPTETGRRYAAVLGLLLCASTHTTPVTGADSANAWLADDPSHGYFREVRGSASVPAQRTVNFNEVPHPDDGLVHLAWDGRAPQPALLARLRYALGGDAGLSSDRTSQGESEVLPRNSDAFVRAKVRLTLGKEWRGFVYADMGAADSALKWQGVAGIRGGHGVDLLGGWRHVTYHFTPGLGFDSLDFNGPFLGATFIW
jgi:hypothetical protein